MQKREALRMNGIWNRTQVNMRISKTIFVNEKVIKFFSFFLNCGISYIDDFVRNKGVLKCI